MATIFLNILKLYLAVSLVETSLTIVRTIKEALPMIEEQIRGISERRVLVAFAASISFLLIGLPFILGYGLYRGLIWPTRILRED